MDWCCARISGVSGFLTVFPVLRRVQLFLACIYFIIMRVHSCVVIYHAICNMWYRIPVLAMLYLILILAMLYVICDTGYQYLPCYIWYWYLPCYMWYVIPDTSTCHAIFVIWYLTPVFALLYLTHDIWYRHLPCYSWYMIYNTCTCHAILDT